MWSFAVWQNTTTIHEDSAAYEVSTSILTTQMEVVTHTLRWIASKGISQTTHAIILTGSMNLQKKKKKVKSELGSTSIFKDVLDMPESR